MMACMSSFQKCPHFAFLCGVCLKIYCWHTKNAKTNDNVRTDRRRAHTHTHTHVCFWVLLPQYHTCQHSFVKLNANMVLKRWHSFVFDNYKLPPTVLRSDGSFCGNVLKKTGNVSEYRLTNFWYKTIQNVFLGPPPPRFTCSRCVFLTGLANSNRKCWNILDKRNRVDVPTGSISEHGHWTRRGSGVQKNTQK